MSFCNTKGAESYWSVTGPEMSVFSINSQSNIQVVEREKKLKAELPCQSFNKLCRFFGFRLPCPAPVACFTTANFRGGSVFHTVLSWGGGIHH